MYYLTPALDSGNNVCYSSFVGEVVRMARRKPQGHYCKICRERKSNESFSGKGYAAHICKACSRLSPQQQAEEMTLNRLSEMPMRYLSAAEIKWLKNRASDHRPAVRELARAVYAERFPHAARNQRKQQLSIRVLELAVDSEVYDLYGDPMRIKENYRITRTPPSIIRTQEDGSVQVVTPQPKELSKLLKWTVHTLEIFYWEQDFCSPFDLELDEPDPVTWRVHVEYSNGEIQDTESTGGIPDRLDELLFSLSEFFE